MIDKEIWPDKLKIQIIRPIYKKGKKQDINNYRPISLLSIIDKILEKFFVNKIIKFFETYKVLNKAQFGYTKNKSTTDLLIEVNEKITIGLNQGKYVGIILIDLQKAFDTFDQKILLKKCQNLGLRGKIYNIIKSYLKDRKSIVQINEIKSTTCNIKYGVPQGSVLGPLLYLIYTNDIDENIERTKIYLFADDTILLSINTNYKEMMDNLQHDFNILNDYFVHNELFISKEKTLQIDITVPKMKPKEEIGIKKHYGNCKNLTKGQKYECHENCVHLEKKMSTKYLGIEIDMNWNFKPHIIALITKIRQIIPKLYQIKNVLNKTQKKTIYNAWIGSILRYGIEIYGHASEYLINRLQKVQNKVIKVIFGTNLKKSTSLLYKEYKILKFKELRNFIVVTRNYFCNKYKTYTNTALTRMRGNKERYKLPNWTNVYGKRRKEWYVPKVFNELPENMLNFLSLDELKKELTSKIIIDDLFNC
jgi:hypothetical protein